MPFNSEIDNNWDGVDRRENTQPWLDGLPPWARAIAVLGLPTVLVFILIWVVVRQHPESRADHAAILAEQKYEHDRAVSLELKQDQIYRLLQRICTNTAKSDVERQRCFDN